MITHEKKSSFTDNFISACNIFLTIRHLVVPYLIWNVALYGHRTRGDMRECNRSFQKHKLHKISTKTFARLNIFVTLYCCNPIRPVSLEAFIILIHIYIIIIKWQISREIESEWVKVLQYNKAAY